MNGVEPQECRGVGVGKKGESSEADCGTEKSRWTPFCWERRKEQRSV